MTWRVAARGLKNVRKGHRAGRGLGRCAATGAAERA